MSTTEIISIVSSLILIGAILYLAKRLNDQHKDKQNDPGMQLLQQQILDLNRQMDNKLSETNRTLNEQLSKSSQNFTQTLQSQFATSQRSLQDASRASNDIIKEVTEKLVKLEETNTQIKGFAGQLQSLENILKNPKQRGILGEYFLENVLKNVLPPKSYQMQYKYKNGTIADAVIFVKDKVIPIDSKFSLENYNRIISSQSEEERERLQKVFKQDLKTRIDETSKYISDDENTVGFAFMFIPSEGIYYDLLINQIGVVKTNTQDLIEYAFKEKSVVIVSPTSFLAYLQTVLQGLRALQIEEQAAEIRTNVDKLRRHLGAYEQSMLKLGRNLGTAVTAYKEAQGEYGKIDKDVMVITGSTESIRTEQISLEQPQD